MWPEAEAAEVGGFVVADPGGRREMPMIAAGLARAGVLRMLATPFGAPAGTAEPKVMKWLPKRVRGRVGAELRRRELPEVLNGPSVEHVGSVLDAIATASARVRVINELVAPSLARLRASVFDHGVSKRLAADDFGVVTVSGAAERTLQRAKELAIPSFLECPVAHHRSAARLLLEEARLQPDYAATLQYHRLPAGFERRLDHEIELASKLLVLSSYQQKTFEEQGVGAEKLVMVPLGVDTEVFQPRPRPLDPFFRVLFVGQITQRKGISYLIEAFERARIPQSELLLLGHVVGTDAPWRGRDGLRHVPHVPPWALPEHYAAADVYVLPSLVEGFPLTAAEAMASGLPVIVSENTFAHDVITDGDNGYVVPIRDSEAIAERLVALYRDASHRHEMGLAARKTAEEFSWERYGERVAVSLTNHAETLSRQPSREIGPSHRSAGAMNA